MTIFCVFKSNHWTPSELVVLFETDELAKEFVASSDKGWDWFIKEFQLGQPFIKGKTLNDLAMEKANELFDLERKKQIENLKRMKF